MNNEEQAKPSPYTETLATPSEKDKNFVEMITKICLLYEYPNFFIAFSPKSNENHTAKNWKGFSNGLSEHMVAYLEIISQAMRETWNKINGK